MLFIFFLLVFIYLLKISFAVLLKIISFIFKKCRSSSRPVQSFSKFAIICVSCASLVFVQIEEANAQASAVDIWTALTPATQLVGALGAAGAAGVAAVNTATGALLGIGPAGWAVIGMGVAAAFFMVGDTNNAANPPTAVVISTNTIALQANPDLAISQGITKVPPVSYTTYAPAINGQVFGYAHIAALSNNPNLVFSSYPSADITRFIARVDDQLKAQGFTRAYTQNNTGAPYSALDNQGSFYFGAPSAQCASGKCLLLNYSSICPPSFPPAACSAGTVPSGIYVLGIQSSSSSTSATHRLYISLNATTGAFECPAGEQYSPTSGACLGTPPANSSYLTDKTCRLSFDNSGNPVWNPFDPDCTNAFKNGSADFGSATTPPGFNFKDPKTGNQMAVNRAATAAQDAKGAGSVNIVNKIVDNTANTTDKKTTSLNPPQVGTKAPPVVGTGAEVLPGTGANVGAAPLSQVVVENWPTTFNVSGTVTCSNCAAANAQAPVVNVAPPNVSINVDKVKIDDEGVSDELPDITQDTSESFLKPLKDRFASFLTVSVSAHTSICPTINTAPISLGVVSFPGAHITSHCDNMEEYRSTLQPLILLGWTVLAILIVMAA